MRILTVVPLYNKKDTIKRAVNGILSQEIYNGHILIIDDGSTDNGLQELSAYFNDARFTFIQQENKGVSATRNIGINYAREQGFPLVAFLDADDYWEKKHINQILSLFEEFPEAQVAASNYRSIDKNGTITHNKFSKKIKYTKQFKNFFKYNLKSFTLNSSNFVAKTTIFDTIGLFNEEYTHGEDTDLFIRIGTHCNVAFHPDEQVVIDKSSENRSDSKEINNKRFIDLDPYQNTQNKALLKYLDLNRFSIAIQYKLAGEQTKFESMIGKINKRHLSKKQRYLLKTPSWLLKELPYIQGALKRRGLYIRTS